MSKLSGVLFAVIGLIFMMLLTLIGLNVVDPQPMIEFAHAVSETFKALWGAHAH